ncbi:hypothetical protein EDC62_0222 [Tibeticola sediminis]|uniref:Uncharacterized protein n=1 Tax=Tibeticola sediminis TaxID=1917811 RepID=A0A3N4UY38_9BURK|nr:hypothetical protein [Tibeticola sediminis]RPE72531.1 hypothetical protein EDC62_0222 [Tibeticola sediminis]
MTPERVRELTGWPEDVPEALLTAHLSAAKRAIDVLTVARAGADYEEAICWEAARTACPVLNTFALAGAAKVGRLEGGVEWRFLAPHEVEALARRFAELRDGCLARLAGAAGAGGFFAAAV